MKLINLLTDTKVGKKYVKAGNRFGEEVTFLYLGQRPDFEIRFNKWDELEQEYASRGYKTISLDDFIAHSYGININHLKQVKRDTQEEPIFYAQIYKNNNLDKLTSTTNLDKITQDKPVQTETYTLPSTKSNTSE